MPSHQATAPPTALNASVTATRAAGFSGDAPEHRLASASEPAGEPPGRFRAGPRPCARSRAAGRARRPRRRRCPAPARHSASSTRLEAEPRVSVHAVDGEEQIEGAVRLGEAHAVGAGERRRRRCRGRVRARSTCRRTKSSPSSSADGAARCMKAATPEVEYWTRFSMHRAERSGGADPADAPAGHRPVLGEGVDEEDAVVRIGDVVEGRRRARPVIDEAAVDLVGDDPEAALARARARIARSSSSRRGPAGRIGGRVDEDARGSPGRSRRASCVEVERPARAVEVERRRRPAVAPPMPMRGGEVRPGRASARSSRRRGPATAATAIWIACMPPPVMKKRSGEKARPNWRVVIARRAPRAAPGCRAARCRRSRRPACERVAASQMKPGRREIALARPRAGSGRPGRGRS